MTPDRSCLLLDHTPILDPRRPLTVSRIGNLGHELIVICASQIFRVARFEPEDEEREPVLFVFQRIEDVEEDEEEEEVSSQRQDG